MEQSIIPLKMLFILRRWLKIENLNCDRFDAEDATVREGAGGVFVRCGRTFADTVFVGPAVMNKT